MRVVCRMCLEEIETTVQQLEQAAMDYCGIEEDERSSMMPEAILFRVVFAIALANSTDLTLEKAARTAGTQRNTLWANMKNRKRVEHYNRAMKRGKVQTICKRCLGVHVADCLRQES